MKPLTHPWTPPSRVLVSRLSVDKEQKAGSWFRDPKISREEKLGFRHLCLREERWSLYSCIKVGRLRSVLPHLREEPRVCIPVSEEGGWGLYLCVRAERLGSVRLCLKGEAGVQTPGSERGG